jgi:hypothetical protein
LEKAAERRLLKQLSKPARQQSHYGQHLIHWLGAHLVYWGLRLQGEHNRPLRHAQTM